MSHIFLLSFWPRGWGIQSVPSVPGGHCRCPSDTCVECPPWGRRTQQVSYSSLWCLRNFRKGSLSLTLLLFHFSVYLPPCILFPSPSPACRPAQDLLSHRALLGRLSCGNSMMYVSKGATRTSPFSCRNKRTRHIFLGCVLMQDLVFSAWITLLTFRASP